MTTPLRLLVEPRDAAAFERALDGGPFVIGRSPSADLVLADSLVSRQHARIYDLDGQWWIEDLGARNRTYLNDRELGTPSLLQPGDRLRIGQTELRVVDERAVAPPDVTPVPPRGDEPVFLRTTAGGSTGVPEAAATADDRQSARIHTLNEVHRALAAAISLPQLLDLILERCFAVLRPEEGVILLKGPDGELRRAASRQSSGQPSELVVSRRVIEEVAGKGKSALVLDAARDERFASSQSIVFSGVRSVVAAPMMDPGGTLGMIALFSRISVRQFSQADLDLLVSLASAAALRVRNVELAEEAAHRRVLDHELSLANEIQMAMLPRQLPHRSEVAVAAALKPARSVGGDLYDFAVDGDRLWFIVADVSGKGVAAALYMAVAKTLFRAVVEGAVSLEHVTARMNRELCRDNERSMFVTAIVGSLDLGTGRARLCDAGHNPPILHRPEVGCTRPALIKGPAFGVFDAAEYGAAELTLAAGDTLVLYTDGMTEARSAAGEQFELGRLEQALAARATEPVDVLVQGLVADVERFAAGAPPEDDLTVLAVRFQGN